MSQRLLGWYEQTTTIRKCARCILRRMPDGKDATIALSDAVRSAISKIVTDYRELASRMRASTIAIWKLAYGGSAVRSVSADVILQLALVRDPVLLLERLRSHYKETPFCYYTLGTPYFHLYYVFRSLFFWCPVHTTWERG